MLSNIFKRVSFLFILISFLFPTFANAKISPSFDCKKASTEVEKLICSNDKLAKLDVEMNKSYKAFMDSLEEELYKDKLKEYQRKWLKNINKLDCFKGGNKNKVSCLISLYNKQLDELNELSKTAKRCVFFNSVRKKIYKNEIYEQKIIECYDKYLDNKIQLKYSDENYKEVCDFVKGFYQKDRINKLNFKSFDYSSIKYEKIDGKNIVRELSGPFEALHNTNGYLLIDYDNDGKKEILNKDISNLGTALQNRSNNGRVQNIVELLVFDENDENYDLYISNFYTVLMETINYNKELSKLFYLDFNDKNYDEKELAFETRKKIIKYIQEFLVNISKDNNIVYEKLDKTFKNIFKNSTDYFNKYGYLNVSYGARGLFDKSFPSLKTLLPYGSLKAKKLIYSKFETPKNYDGFLPFSNEYRDFGDIISEGAVEFFEYKGKTFLIIMDESSIANSVISNYYKQNNLDKNDMDYLRLIYGSLWGYHYNDKIRLIKPNISVFVGGRGRDNTLKPICYLEQSK